jgi:amino acid transporter
MGGIAAWGIRESVLFASAMTILEISGLLAIIAGGFSSDPSLLLRMNKLIPDWNSAALIGVLQASLLAFFAFIGFEDIANIAEEVRDPRRTIPRAIVVTLGVSSLLYILVVIVALSTVGAEALAGQSAPLSLLFSKTTGLPPLAISLIAVVATLNGVIVQIIMISRLTYGMSSRRLLPEFLSRVNERTRTPLYATILATAAILGLALNLHIITLAEWTSRIILLIFAIVCLSLLRIKLRGEPVPEGAFQTPTWIPAAGVVACLALLGLDVLVG